MTLNGSFREIVRETILGFIFWSVFEALAPMIWFYPLNAMEVSGYEVFLLVLFSPLLMESTHLRKVIQSRNGMAFFRILTLISLSSFHLPNTLLRLTILSFGNFVGVLLFTSSVCSHSDPDRLLNLWGLVLGKIFLLSTRIWYTSYTPTWYDSRTNSIIITVGTIATLDKIFYGYHEKICIMQRKSKDPLPVSWTSAAVGFGSLLFLTQWVFGEVSVVLRWIGQPHPETGPQPYPWGTLVLLAILSGIWVSFYLHKIPLIIWWIIGLCSFFCINYQTRWIGCCGGLVLAVFVFSLWPAMIELLHSCPPGRTVALAIFTWCFEILYEIWTVAYNFVPGGVFTREHTDYLIIIVMTGLLAGMRTIKDRKPRRIENKETKIKIAFVLALIALIGVGGYVVRHSGKQHSSKGSKDSQFSAGIWAFHFGYDNQGWPSVKQSSQFIKNTNVDIMGLLETDASKPFLGNNDLVSWLSERLGMYADFGPSTRQHCWGVALLSKYPIIHSSHHLLPSPHGELAAAIMATVNLTGHLVDVVVTHMGNDWDTLDRKLQAGRLSELLRQAENPVVFLGYVTSKPGSRDYLRLINNGNVKDIDETDKKRFCLYIMYRGLIRLGYARISHGGLSDTEVQMAKFKIPKTNNYFTDNNVITTNPMEVEDDIRFNSVFGGYRIGHNWAENHRFHMSTPKYFLPEA